MRPSHSRSPIRRDLRLMTCDATAFSVMVGLGEANIVAFGLTMGLTETLGGLLATIPMLLGALLQLITPRGVVWVGSNRRWVLICVIAQMITYLLLAAAALRGLIPTWMLFAVVVLYWTSAMSSGPPYNTWAATLVPSAVRAVYFARRSRFTQSMLFLSVLLGGLYLQRGAMGGYALQAFAVLFCLAFVFRGISCVCLAHQREPIPLPPGHRLVSPGEFFRRFRHSEDGRLLLYLVLLQISAQIAQPFFTPYMLGELNFSYLQLNAFTATAFAAKIIAMPLIGMYAARAGAKRLLLIGGCGIIPLPALWMISDAPQYLIAFQCFSGAAWGCYELAALLLFFEALRAEERTSLLTTFNLCNCTAMVAGSLLGAALLHRLGETQWAYLTIFGISTIARTATLPFLLRFVPRPFRVVPMATDSDAVLPSAGSFDRPILASLPEQSGLPEGVEEERRAAPRHQ